MTKTVGGEIIHRVHGNATTCQAQPGKGQNITLIHTNTNMQKSPVMVMAQTDNNLDRLVDTGVST